MHRGLTSELPIVSSVVLAAAVVVFYPRSTRAAEEAISLGTESQIFVDDDMIAAKEGVMRRSHACKKLPAPVMRAEASWEHDGDDHRIYVYGTVLRDEKTGQFRLWYNRGHRTLLATSKDGVNWERPSLGVWEFEGSKGEQRRSGPRS